jgi:hypothetical protein
VHSEVYVLGYFVNAYSDDFRAHFMLVRHSFSRYRGILTVAAYAREQSHLDSTVMWCAVKLDQHVRVSFQQWHQLCLASEEFTLECEDGEEGESRFKRENQVSHRVLATSAKEEGTMEGALYTISCGTRQSMTQD